MKKNSVPYEINTAKKKAPSKMGLFKRHGLIVKGLLFIFFIQFFKLFHRQFFNLI